MGKYRWIVMLILISLLLSGCWDYTDVDERHVAILTTIDLKEGQSGTMRSGGTYIGGVVVPSLNPQIGAKSRFETFSGQTISQAREERFGYSPGRPLIGLLQVILIGNEVARSGVDNWLNIYSRDSVIKYNLHMAVTKGRAEQVARSKDPNYVNAGEHIKLLLEQTDKVGFYAHYDLRNYIVDMATPGKNPVMPLFELRNKEIACIGSAVFRKDKLVAELDLPETRTLILLRQGNNKGHIPYVIRQGEKVIDRGGILVGNQRRVKVTRRGDEFFFDITIKIKGRLLERASSVSLIDNPDQLKAIEQAVENQTQSDCYQLIGRMQEEWKLDAIDISRYALAKWRQELERRIDKDFIQKAHINVKVEVKIGQFGEMT